MVIVFEFIITIIFEAFLLLKIVRSVSIELLVLDDIECAFLSLIVVYITIDILNDSILTDVLLLDRDWTTIEELVRFMFR